MSNMRPGEEFAGNASSISPSSPTSDLWNCDTGATAHMTPHRTWLHTYQPTRIPVRLADGKLIYSAGVGTVLFQSVIRGEPGIQVEFSRVLHMPDLRNNLVAVLQLSRVGIIDVSITGSHMRFLRSGELLFTGTINERNVGYLDGYTVQQATIPASAMLASPVSILARDTTLWHRRYGHLHIDAIRTLHKHGLVTGMQIDSSTAPDPICEPCIMGKMHRGPIPKVASRATRPLALIHSDLYEMPVHTPEGFRYWVSFIDDATCMWCVSFLKTKDGAFAAFKAFKVWAETQLEGTEHSGCHILALHDDKGGEYMSKAFEQFCTDHGIERRHTVRNEPHQNGVAERANRTLAEAIIAMLVNARLPPSYWRYAVCTFVYLHNRAPTTALKDRTPFEAWYGRKPDVSHLRIFGCLAYVHVQKDQRKGLKTHAQRCLFIDYPAEYKGWAYFNLETRKLQISNAAIFDERVFPGLSRLPPASPVPLPSHIHYEHFLDGFGDQPDQVGVLENPQQVDV